MESTASTRSRRLGLLLALMTLMLLVAPQAAAQERLPDLRLRIWPSPSTAARGEIVRYDVTVENQGLGKAGRVRVTLPFPKGQLTVAKVEMAEKTTWVQALADDSITIMFGTLRSGEKREARVFLLVGKDAAPDGAPIRIRATARYSEDAGEKLRSNETSLIIAGSAPDTKPTVTVAPASGPAGSVFRFSVSNYFPEEKLFTWINAPDQVLASGIVTRATEQGDATLDLDSKRLKLTPGMYSMVVLGDSSKITTVTPFEVK
jgi:Domain of unknown function DUF11